MKILVLNGPNLNMTGSREQEIYGTKNMDEIIRELTLKAEERSIEITHLQTNYEGKLIDELQAAHGKYDGVLINAGALTHYSYSLRDAIACCRVPVGEVHMSDIEKREEFRRTDVIREVCAFRVMGLGAKSYERALEIMAELIER